MIKGKKYNGFLADIWSCGVILYVMLCGYLPFDGFSNNDLFKKIMKCKVSYPNNIDKSAIDLMKNILVANPEKRIDISKIKTHPFYLKGRNIFKQKYPELVNEVEKENLVYAQRTLKKSISDPFNENIINNNKKKNYESEKRYKHKRKTNLSANKNEYNQENIEKNNENKNNDNNVYNNLLCHTKNINYYKKILSGRLTVHNIRKNKNKLEENNENTPKSKITPIKNKESNDNKLIRTSSKKSEKLSKNNRNQAKICLSNSVNSKEPRKKNLELYLKSNPFNTKIETKFEKNDSVNIIKTLNKLDNEPEISEDKKRVSTTVLSFTEKYIKAKYGCISPNYILLQKLLKNPPQNQVEEEKDNNNNNNNNNKIIQESIVYNAQRETQTFNINHTINKIKKLKRIYENEINNITGNEKKNKEYISSNNSNSNFTLIAQKAKTKVYNDIPKNNYAKKKKLKFKKK
jgi:5'-AMP-activated protein kinase catalytic alpha subunit